MLEQTVYWKRERWGYLIFFNVYVLYRVFSNEYLGLLFLSGLYAIYYIVQYFTPLGLPDPDEDEAEGASMF